MFYFSSQTIAIKAHKQHFKYQIQQSQFLYQDPQNGGCPIGPAHITHLNPSQPVKETEQKPITILQLIFG